MNIESQVCALEYSKRLDELGIKKKSIFVWEYFNNQCYAVRFIPNAVVPGDFSNVKWFKAYTASELGEMLPYEIHGKSLIIEKCYSNLWSLKYTDKDYLREQILAEFNSKKQSDASAKMLIHLLENGLVKVEDL